MAPQFVPLPPMSFFHGAQHTNIYGGNFVASSSHTTHERERLALEELKRHSTSKAFHNSKYRYDPPKCLPQTREAVFQEIREWLHGPNSEKPILWMSGPAGAGKSAIAQSVAEKARELDYLLVASFFFNRSDPERNNAERLIPSIAYQMISSIPSTRPLVLKSICDRPHLFSLDIHSQLEMLIVEPLSIVDVSDSETIPRLILVDGLDECSQENERMECLRAIEKAFSASSFPLTVLCTSRPESDIRGAFNDPNFIKLSHRIILDDHFDPSSDIENFLVHEFTQIKISHPLKEYIPPDWPSYYDLQQLVRKSSGQFIYASTVVKHVASRIHDPMKRLCCILTVGSGSDASPFKEVDALYRFVLSSIPVKYRSIVIRILGMICLSRVDQSPSRLEGLFNLAPGAVLLLLENLHSLIDVRGPEETVRPLHASLSDFLADRFRSGIHHLDVRIHLADLVLQGFRYPPEKHPYIPQARTTQLFEIEQPLSCIVSTHELLQFFSTFSWKLCLRGLQAAYAGVPLHTDHHHRNCSSPFSNFPYIITAFNFCKWAAKLSSDWLDVQRRAEAQLNLYIIDHLSRFNSPPAAHMAPLWQGTFRIYSPEPTWELQRPLRAWLWRLYATCLMGSRDGDRLSCTRPPVDSQDFFEFLCRVMRNTGNTNGFYVNPTQHHLVIYNTLVSFGRAYLWNGPSDVSVPKLERDCFGRGILATMLDCADRTPYLDDIISHLECLFIKDKVCCSYPPDGIKHFKEAIMGYKAKLLPDDYDDGWKLMKPYQAGIEDPPYLFLDEDK